jgi:hypothetical protein
MMIWEWVLFYLVPAALATFISTRFKSFNARLVPNHIGLLVSIFSISLVGARLQTPFQIYPFIFLCASMVASAFLLIRLSPLYIVSSIIQEYCILLAAVLVNPTVGIIWAAIGTGLVYSMAHMADLSQWDLKLPITFVWGISSILLYHYTQQPMFNFAIHILGGSIFIRIGLLYYGQDQYIRKTKL